MKTKIEKCKDHPEGCYLRLNDKQVANSEKKNTEIVIDYDKEGNIVGISFLDGLKCKKLSERLK